MKHEAQAKLNMNQNPHDQIKSILDSGEFDQLIGLKEDLVFEAKGPAPYDLDDPVGRFELAKDVTAFANSSGGYILVGLEHEPLPAEHTDQVKRLQLVKESEFKVSQIVGVLKEYTYPRIHGIVQVTWVASKDDTQLGLGVIYIPNQADVKKPFLIAKVAQEGQAQKEIIIGIARRVGGDNVPLKPVEIYDAIRQGRDPVVERAQRIEEKLDALLKRPVAGGPQVAADEGAILEARIRDMLE